MSTRAQGAGRAPIGPEGDAERTSLPPLGDLRGMRVRDADGERVGTVEDIYVDREGDRVRYLAIETGWFGDRLLVIPIDDVTGVDDGHGGCEVALPYDADRLRAAPAYDRGGDIDREQEQEIYGHFDREAYWDIVSAKQSTPAPTPEIALAEVEDAVRRGKDPRRILLRRW